MTTLAARGTRPSLSPRVHATAGAVAITILAATAIMAFSTAEAVGGGLVERAIIPLRMLLLVLAATLLLRFSGGSWGSVGLGAPARKGRTALLVIGGYLAIGSAFALLAGLVLPAFGLAPGTSETFAGLTGNTGLYLYLLLVVAWGSAAFGEELVFRGFLQTRLEQALAGSGAAAALAVLTQAIIFGALHAYLGAGGAILAGTTGLIIGLVYLAAGRNLWACIILHGLVDTVSLSAIYLGVA